MDSLIVAVKTLNTPINYQILIIGILSTLGAGLIFFLLKLFLKGKLKIFVIGEFIHSLQIRKRRSISLCNDLIQCLDRTSYNHRYTTNDKKPLFSSYDYSSVNLDHGIVSNLSDFLRGSVNPGYEDSLSSSNVKSKNIVIHEINKEFPIIYEKIYKLFERGYCDRNEIRKMF